MHYFHTHVEMNGTSLMLMRLWIGQKLIFNLLLIRIRIYVRPEMKFQPTIKEILFTLLFIVGEVKMKFRFRGWSEKNSPFSKSNEKQYSHIYLSLWDTFQLLLICFPEVLV